MSFVHNKKRSGYSLVEILVAMVIVSTTLLLSLKSIYNAQEISIANEISDRAANMGIKVLEIAKNPNRTAPSCANQNVSIPIDGDSYYAVGNVNLTQTGGTTGICITKVNDTAPITTCSDTSQYKTTLIVPAGFTQRVERYCVQLSIKSSTIPGNVSQNVVVTVVYDELKNINSKKVFYGIR